MNNQTTDIIKYLEAAKEERAAAELKLNQIVSKEAALKDELAKTFKCLKEYLEGEGIIEKECIPQIHNARTKAGKAMEAKANEIITEVYSDKQSEEESAAEESDKEVSADMALASSVFHRRATECPNVTVRDGKLCHRNRALNKLEVVLRDLFTTDDFNKTFSWTNIKVIKINGLYTSGDDLTGIVRNILAVILKSKPLDKLKILRKGAQILNKTIQAMDAIGINYIKENPDVVTIKGSTGNKIKGLVYILRCTNHIDMIDGIEFYTTEE